MDGGIKLSVKEKDENFNLYVLRYNYSGNYYVGITNNFEKRMLVHWRRTSVKRKLPLWSKINNSTKGFRFYWFKINNTGVSQSYADQCENQFAEKIIKKINDINDENFIKKIHVGNGNCIDRKHMFDIKIKLDYLENEINYIDERIADCLFNPEKFNFKNEKIQIECFNSGYLGEYHSSQHDKSLREVVH